MSARDHRERQIAEVLIRYGLSYLGNIVGLGHLMTAAHRRVGVAPEARTPAVNLRLALEELGPTFIKLGQLMSTRADLLSTDYRAELAKLQDSAPAVPSEVVEEVVERELHAPADRAFATFETAPLACASVGQAHTATLDDGTEVVVKVRRPDVVEDVERDLEIVRNFAARAGRRSKTAARYDVVGLADEFVRSLRAQLDYLQEARNAERFAANFAGDPWVQIPRVFPDHTTSRVITLERIRGMKITDLAALDEAGLDRHALAERTALITAKMIFDDGFFHADPHPGNFFIEPTGRVGSSTSAWSAKSTTNCASSSAACFAGSCGGTRVGWQTLCSGLAPRPRPSIELAYARTWRLSSRAISAAVSRRSRCGAHLARC